MSAVSTGCPPERCVRSIAITAEPGRDGQGRRLGQQARRTDSSSSTWSTSIPIERMRSITPRPASGPCSGSATAVPSVRPAARSWSRAGPAGRRRSSGTWSPSPAPPRRQRSRLATCGGRRRCARCDAPRSRTGRPGRSATSMPSAGLPAFVDPERRAGEVQPVVLEDGAAAGVLRTYDPEPALASISPSVASTWSACLAAVSPTPYLAMIALRDGTLAPGLQHALADPHPQILQHPAGRPDRVAPWLPILVTELAAPGPGCHPARAC